MSARNRQHLRSTLGLILLAFVATGLSFAALFQDRLMEAEPVGAGSHRSTPLETTTSSASPSADSPQSPSATRAQPTPRGPSLTPAATESTPAQRESTAGASVVILGDRYSADRAPGVWVKAASKKLGWTSVTNLSAAGRGYTKEPDFCDKQPCTNFEGSLSTIVKADPDLVITFGGASDDDNDLSAAAMEYYAALREALPEADIVAISPVTTQEPVPYWMGLHDRTIRASVEAIGGTFVDVGQPGVGDGDELAAKAQKKIAKTIIGDLS